MEPVDRPCVRVRDGLMSFWVVLWLVVGGWTGYEIWQLTALSASTVESGQSLGVAAGALQNLSGLPVVGESSKNVGDQISATAADIVAAGRQADRSLRGMAVLVGLAVALGPS